MTTIGVESVKKLQKKFPNPFASERLDGSTPFRSTMSEQALCRLLRLFSKVRARSCSCSPFPNRTRFAGFRFSFCVALMAAFFIKTRQNKRSKKMKPFLTSYFIPSYGSTAVSNQNRNQSLQPLPDSFRSGRVSFCSFRSEGCCSAGSSDSSGNNQFHQLWCA